ncbi:MAG: MlaD family protein [Cyclobacteriaceae bacterium]|nr:MlaD family protein [Cyclobacteriaceae bacterium]
MAISKEVRVGAFAIFAITILYLGFNYLKGVDFLSNTSKYYVIYEDVAGLTKSNPVKISGYTVGRVSNIKLLQNKKNRVLIELDINSDIILGDTALAKLNSDLLGGVSIIVFPGNLDNPIEPGDTLNSRIDPDLTELFKESAQPISDNLQITMRKLNILLDDLSGSGTELKKSLESFTKLSNNLNARIYENRSSLKTTLAEFAKLSKNLNQTVVSLKPTLDNFKTLSDSLANLELNTTLQRVDVLLEQLTLTAQMFQNDSSTIGKLLTDDALYESMGKTMADLDTLLVHINENPKHFFGPLGKSKKQIEKEAKKQ